MSALTKVSRNAAICGCPSKGAHLSTAWRAAAVNSALGSICLLSMRRRACAIPSTELTPFNIAVHTPVEREGSLNVMSSMGTREW